MRIFFLIFSKMILNVVVLCLKLLSFAFLSDILEMFLCLLVPNIEVVPDLDVHQPQIKYRLQRQ
jgi:hypothetical protein